MGERKNLVNIKNGVQPPDLLAIQKNSFRWFLQEGLPEELRLISPIKGYEGKLELVFTGKVTLGKPKHEARDCLVREVTFCAPLKVEARLLNKKTKEVKSNKNNIKSKDENKLKKSLHRLWTCKNEDDIEKEIIKIGGKYNIERNDLISMRGFTFKLEDRILNAIWDEE